MFLPFILFILCIAFALLIDKFQTYFSERNFTPLSRGKGCNRDYFQSLRGKIYERGKNYYYSKKTTIPKDLNTCGDIIFGMTIGTFLLYRGQEHLVYRGNILREEPLEGVGRIPLLLLPTVDLWNFNAHHNETQIGFAKRYAESVGMIEEPINIVEGGGRSIDGKTQFGPIDYLRVKDVSDDAPLSTLVDRMLFYDGTKVTSLGLALREYPDLKFAAPSEHRLSSELKKEGLVLNQNVSNIKKLTDIILSMERADKQVHVGRDAHSIDGTAYPDAVSVYTN